VTERKIHQVVAYECPDHLPGDEDIVELQRLTGCFHCGKEGDEPGQVAAFPQVGSEDHDAYRADPEAWIARQKKADIANMGFHLNEPDGVEKT